MIIGVEMTERAKKAEKNGGETVLIMYLGNFFKKDWEKIGSPWGVWKKGQIKKVSPMETEEIFNSVHKYLFKKIEKGNYTLQSFVGFLLNFNKSRGSYSLALRLKIQYNKKVLLMISKVNMFQFSNKGISTPLGLFVVVSLTILAAIAVFLQYSEMEKEKALMRNFEKSEKVSWITYHNEQHGFKFRHPQDAEITEQEDKVRLDFTFAPATNLAEKYLEITIRDNGSEKCSNPLKTNIIRDEVVNLGGLDLKKEIGQEDKTDSISYSISKGDHCIGLSFVLRAGESRSFSFDVTLPSYDLKEEVELFDKIMSTFELTEISNLEIYRDESEEKIEEEPAPQAHIQSIFTDKKLYRSSEIVNLDLTIFATGNLKDVAVKIMGIKNKLNQEKVLDIIEGENNISFSYQLPKCNVCGGISAGEYPIDCEVNYSGLAINDSITIDVQQ